MKVEDLDQAIAKKEERLKQLKAQKQALLAREKDKALFEDILKNKHQKNLYF
ncbi:hypothetical protein [Acinetobacter johnsonii]|uniref:hypothetical protein n=1 Tax=Acinetobacter johnsonii TaxID=40214 RepID=UPI003F547068